MAEDPLVVQRTETDLSTLFGKEFSISSVEWVAEALLMAPPQLAAELAARHLETSRGSLPVLLATLFSQRDVETAHAVLVRTQVPWTGALQLEVRRLVIEDLQGSRALPCSGQRQHHASALALFERYVLMGTAAFACQPVVLPTGSPVKFMFLEVNREPLFRAGGRYHKDILRATISELLDRGMAKAVTTVVPLGGGMIGLEGRGVCLFGESQDFGRADFERVRELIGRHAPNVPVRIR